MSDELRRVGITTYLDSINPYCEVFYGYPGVVDQLHSRLSASRAHPQILTWDESDQMQYAWNDCAE
jgi:hypothetical protein